MGKKTPHTPRSKVRAALRQLWLRSRERSTAMKAEDYCCENCNVKQSRAKGRVVKIQVHHKDRIDWEDLINLVYERLLHHPDRLEVLCEDCHKETHRGGMNARPNPALQMDSPGIKHSHNKRRRQSGRLDESGSRPD